MEMKLNGMWQLALDPTNIGEDMKWYIPDAFPVHREDYWVPQHHDSSALTASENTWIIKSFDMDNIESDSIYNLVFYGADKARVWLNGIYVGQLDRTVKKQVIDLSKAIQINNTLIIKFEDVSAQTVGITKAVYVMVNKDAADLASQIADPSPEWVNSALGYCVYTRNFSEKGDFESVYQKLEYIRSLGTTMLWFLPIHPIGQIGRKGDLGSPYAITDYYEINNEYGSHADFKKIVEKAHKLGMKVILDLVINHTAKDNVMSEIDPHYHKPEDQRIADLWGWTDVTDLDYSYPPTRDYIKNMMAYWIREFDIDGYRCDVAFMVPDDFWKESIEHIRSIKPDLVMMAESDVPEQHLAGFNITYDWHFMGLLHRIGSGYYPVTEVKHYIDTVNEYFPINALRMLFVENHDTERAAHIIPANRLLTMQLIKMFAPGIPLIYNGEENGIDHRPDLFTKDSIDWNFKQNEINRCFNYMGELRQKTSALQHQDLQTINIDINKQMLQIERKNSEDILSLDVDTQTLTYKMSLNGKVIYSSGE